MESGNEYLQTLLKANEEAVLNSYKEFKKCNSLDEREKVAEIIKNLSDQQLNGIKVLIDSEKFEVEHDFSERKFEAEQSMAETKTQEEIEARIEQLKKDIWVDAATIGTGVIMQLVYMGFYKARYKEGLLFETEGTVASSFVRNVMQRLPDFMKPKK